MKEIRCIAVLALAIGAFGCDALATDRFFNDVSAESPSKRYKVEAKSPDNARKKGRIAFQSSFVYTCCDTGTKQVLWTREQTEGSPEEIFVSDTGWTVIRTGGDELIAVDPAGHDRSRIRFLSEGLTKEERAKYVSNTTAGPMWSDYSLWYFLDAAGQHLFVVRPWWGRRVIMNIESGKLLAETSGVSTGAASYERNYVLTELARGVESRGKLEKEECCEALWPILTAAYLAGRLPVAEAVPLLEKLQEVSSVGSSTGGGLGTGEKFEGEVNPHSYSTFTLRQVAHLSMRRLGKVPKPLPANEFDVQYAVYEKHHPYKPKALSVSRTANAEQVKEGMRAEQVLDLVGAPDFVGYDTWEYDMDADRPFSLILKWDARQVIGVQRKTPALWKQGFVRDEQIVR